jgi:hypothetical protein
MINSRAKGARGERQWRDQLRAEGYTAKRLERERDEAREENKNLKLQLGLWEDGNLICEETLGEIRLLEERIEEAQKELSSIHRWIDKNHADGFIDSLTYLQNLERVADNWYDRIDAIEADARRFVRERDKAMKLFESGKRACASLNEALDKTLHELREVRDQNAKLRDIAERLFAAVVGRMKANDWRTLRAELDQIKEGAK